MIKKKLPLFFFFFILFIPTKKNIAQSEFDFAPELQKTESNLTGIFLASNVHYKYANNLYIWDAMFKLNLVFRNNYSAGWAMQYIAQEPIYISDYQSRMLLSGLTTGLDYEKYFLNKKRIRINIPMYFAIGMALLEENDFDYYSMYYESAILEENFLAIAEIGFQLEFRLGQYTKLGIGTSYRVTNFLNMTKKSPYDFYGYHTGIEFKWGKFD